MRKHLIFISSITCLMCLCMGNTISMIDHKMSAERSFFWSISLVLLPLYACCRGITLEDELRIQKVINKLDGVEK